MTNILKAVITTLFFTFVLAGCASSYQYASKDPSLQITDERIKALSERDLAYWEYFSKNDFDATYKYELPHLQYLKSLAWYKNFYASANKNFTMQQSKITLVNSDRAIIKHHFRDKEGNSLELEDRWVLVKDTWFHYFDLTKLPLNTPPF